MNPRYPSDRYMCYFISIRHINHTVTDMDQLNFKVCSEIPYKINVPKQFDLGEWDLRHHDEYHLLRSKITNLLSQINNTPPIHHPMMSYPS